jgi:hypothetical protein
VIRQKHIFRRRCFINLILWIDFAERPLDLALLRLGSFLILSLLDNPANPKDQTDYDQDRTRAGDKEAN